MKEARSRRPVFLDLWRIRFPIGAIASIGHRVAGVLVALALPALVTGFVRSLESEQSFRAVVALLRSPLGLLALLVLCWAFGHHLLAGVRHLLMDAHFEWSPGHPDTVGRLDVGGRHSLASLHHARAMAWSAIVGGIVLGLLLFTAALSALAP